MSADPDPPVTRPTGRRFTERERGRARGGNGLELCEQIQRGSRGNREKTGGTVNNLVLSSLEKV